MEIARTRLATLMRLAMPDIIKAVAEEAARSTNTASAVVRATEQEYETWLWRYVPRTLEAVASNDQQRAALLGSFAMVEANPTIRPVPPLARVGLLSIGLRLAREHVARLVDGSPESEAVLHEFDRFDVALRASVAPLAARA